MTGHPDMFRLAASGLLRVWEVKTIGLEKFKTLIAPEIGYTWQVQAYLWAMPKQDALPMSIDPYVAYIIYIVKGEAGSYPMKAFVVRRDKFIVRAIKEKLTLYHRGVSKGEMPEVLKKCQESAFTSWEAKKCPCLDLCRQEIRNTK